MRKPRIAWFTPSSQYPNSISAIFTGLILPKLSDRYQIQIFTDFFDDPISPNSAHYLTAADAHQKDPFDLFIYQIENDSCTDFARAYLGIIPGLVIFHHINFLNYGSEAFLNSPWRPVVAKFSDLDLAWPKRSDKFEKTGYFADREVGMALQAIFTNPQNVSEYRRLAGASIASTQSLSSYYLSYPCQIESDPLPLVERCLACLARPGIPDRAFQILEALKDNPDWSLNWLIEDDESEALQELIKDYGVQSQIKIFYGRTLENWQKVLAVSSVILHLSFSVFDQPAPFFPVSLQSGRPVVVSDYAYFDSLPEDIVFKVKPGLGEAEELSGLLQVFAKDPAWQSFSKGRDYALEHHQVARVAKELHGLIDSNLESYRRFYSIWENFSKQAMHDLVREVQGIMDQSQQGLPADFSWEKTLKNSFKDLGWLG